MDLQEIRELVETLENSSLQELKVKDKDFEITLKKAAPAPAPRPVPPVMTVPFSVPGMPAPGPQQPGPAVPAEEPESDEDFIISPIVGVFYSASAPDVPAYVRIGDRFRKGDTVCILEAMKVMNEITADYDCEIEAVLVSNAQKVEYGQPLFRVKRR